MRKKYEVIYEVGEYEWNYPETFIPTDKRHSNLILFYREGEREWFKISITVYECLEAQRIYQEAIKKGYKPTIVER